MPATIRLQRVGRKKQASFRIVVTDKSAARGAPAIEILGTYNPRTRPSSIRFDAARALHWLRAGALPSHSVESIFRKTGVMNQFRSGVEPAALTETLVTMGSPFGGGKTSQRGLHGTAPAPKEAPEDAPEAKAEAEGAVAEAEVEVGAEEAVAEAEEVVAEADAEEAVAEVEEVVAEADAEEAVAEAEVEVGAEDAVAEVEEVVAEADAEEAVAEAEEEEKSGD